MNKFDTKSLRKSVTVYMAVTMLILSVATAIITMQIQEYRQEYLKNQYNKQIHRNMQHVLNHYQKNHTNFLQRIIKTNDIATLLKNRDRESLYNLLSEKWKFMQEQDKYLKIMQIHLADGTSFLRVHKPDTFGDNLTDIRPMLKEIHSSHKMISGYETGKYSNVYRSIYPIFDKEKKYVGAMELGINPNFILSNVKEMNGFEGMMFIKDDTLKLYSIPSDIVIDGYRLQSKLSPKLKDIYKVFKVSNHLLDSEKISVDDTTYLTHIFNLKDFKNQIKVKIIFFKDISDTKIFSNYFLIIILGLVVFVLSLLVWLIYRRVSSYQEKVDEVYDEQINMIKNAKEYFQTIFDITPDIMITTDGEGIDKVNSAMIDFFGFENLDDFKNEHECICDYFIDVPDCIKTDMNGVRWLEYILNNQTSQHRVCMLKNGKKNFFLVRAKLLKIDEKYNSVVIFTDVTEIEKLSNLLDNTINSVENIIFVKDNKFRYLECNEAFEKFTGLSRDELIGKTDYDLFDKDVADFFRKKDKEMLACGEARQNYEWVTYPDGKKVYLLTFKSPLHNRNGQIIGLVGNSADLTEQKRLEKELLNTKQQFEKFMEFIPASIFIKDENHCIVYANTTAKAFFNNKDIIGLKVEDFLSAADIKTANELENKIIEFGRVDEIKKFTNYNNEKNIFRTLGFKIEDENTQKIAAVIVDITKEFHLQEELRKEGEKSQQLGMILENSINEVYIFAQNNFRFLYINQGAKDNLGYSMKEMYELTPVDIKPDMSSDELDELLKPLVEGEVESISFSTIHQRKDKTTYPVDVYVQSIKYEEIDAYIAIVIDITEKKKIENELLDKEEIMLAQSRHAAMGEMISMIAHQWRQPISVIAMDANNILADIELEMVEEESLQTGAEDIIKQTQELSKTIDDFRNFFRPEKIPEEVFLDDIISDALGVIGKSLQHNNVEVILDTDKEIKLKTYSRELMQVLINLIKNAKEVLLENSVNDGKISISTKDDGKSILVTICDNGGGVKDEIQDKIFEPYFTTKGEKNGTGLGLYMSKTIIEKHFFGRLSVYNEKEGACFEINLPLNIKDSGELDG